MHALVFLCHFLADQEVPTKVLGFHAAKERQNQRIDPGTQGELQSKPVDGGACILEILIYFFKKGIVSRSYDQGPTHSLLSFCKAKETA